MKIKDLLDRNEALARQIGELSHHCNQLERKIADAEKKIPPLEVDRVQTREHACRVLLHGIRTGKIGAIKAVRELTGMALKEAHALVESEWVSQDVEARP